MKISSKNIEQLIYIFLFTFSFQHSNAQVFDTRIKWDLGPSAYYFSDIRACATRSNGNNLIAIHRYNAGQGACMLAEISNTGDTLWTNPFTRGGSFGENFISFIKELPNHNIFMAGGTHNSSGQFHAAFFLADSTGQIIQYKKVYYGSNLPMVINDVDMAPDGSIFFAGQYNDLFSGGSTGYSWTVPVYGRLNTDLSINWSRTYGSTNHTYNFTNSGKVASIRVTPDNNLVIAGTDAVDPNDGYLGTFQLAKLTINGAMMWSIQRPLTTHSYPSSLTILPNGDIYAFSEIYYLSPFGDYDFTLEKFDMYGNYKWGKSYGTALSDNMTKAIYNPNNHQFAIVGTHSISATEDRAWLCTLDTSGQIMQNKLFGAPSSHYNMFNDICIYKNLYLITGTAFTYEGMLTQTDWNGNTGCAPSSFNLQTAALSSVFTPGLSFHNTIQLLQTSYQAVKVNYPYSSITACYSCSDVSVNQTISACGSYYVGGALQTSSGTYRDSLAASGGCDSIVVTQLSISQIPSTANAGIDQSICTNAASLTANIPLVGTGHWSILSGSGTLLNANAASTGINGLTTGTTTLRWTISNGSCTATTDDISIHIGVANSSTISHAACLSYSLYAQTYTASGTYTQTLTNASGCDSVLTLYLSIYQPSSSNTNTSVCSNDLPYVWNGMSISFAGSYSDTLLNARGCDSIANLNLSIKNFSTSSTTVSACSNDLPFVWNNNSFSTAGNYTVTLSNAAGCDSLASLDLQVKSASSSTTSISVCSNDLPYTWNGIPYSSGGTYTVNFTNSIGCDSIATLQLSVKNASTSTATATVCSANLPYNWNGNAYTSAGNYTAHFTNALGCDSAAYLNLAVTSIDLSLNNNDPTLTANQSGANYQWINCATNQPIANQTNANFNATSNGSYAVVVYYNGCHDTSACETIINTSNWNIISEQNLNLFPNPFQDMLFLNVDLQFRNASYEITDKLGQIVSVGQLDKKNNILNLASLSNGLYAIRIKNKDIQKILKIIKE